MSFENAQKLVSKMRDDKEFRNNCWRRSKRAEYGGGGSEPVRVGT
jgi:hypothetical protein